MNQQEILKTLDLPFPCDFAKLHALCRDLGTFERVLSLAISRGAENGRAKAFLDFNGSAKDCPAPIEVLIAAGSPGEDLSEPVLPTYDVVPDNPVGYVAL